MMKIYPYLAASALLMAVAACSNDDLNVPAYDNNPSAVRIQPSVSGIVVTRTTPEAEGSTVFAGGDQIRVSRDGAEFYLYNKVGEGWTPAQGTSYLMWDTDETSMELQAYYPATAGMTSFTLPRNQSGIREDDAQEGVPYQIAQADYMTFNGTVAKEADNSASFVMLRRTVRIRVTIDGFGDQYAAGSTCDVKIRSPYTSVNVNYSDPTPVVAGSGNSLLVTPLNGKDMVTGGTAIALVAPSSAAMPNENFMEVAVNGETTPLYVKGIPAHEAGYSYDYHLTVGKNGIVINSVLVNPWNDPIDVNGGTAVEKTDPKVDKANHAIKTYNAGQIYGNPELIESAIGTGNTLIIEGPMDDTDIEALKTYLVDHPAAALELDLSKVTELTTFPSYGFSQYDNGSTRGLKSIVLPDVMTKIGSNAFWGYCTELESVTLPAGLKEIEGAAFSGCSKLSTIKVAGKETINELPEGLVTLKDAAFRGTILETITIPSSLTTVTLSTLRAMPSLTTVYWKSSAAVPFWCFCECTSLTDIYFTSETAPTVGNDLGDYIFSDLPQEITIHIPAAYEDNYSAWKALENNTEGWNITCVTE